MIEKIIVSKIGLGRKFVNPKFWLISKYSFFFFKCLNRMSLVLSNTNNSFIEFNV